MIVVGMLVRVWWWAQARSLWIDEAMVAVNVLGRGLIDLTTAPLNMQQAAPPGFLAILWFAARAPIPIEYALRLPALAFGLALLPMTAVLTRRLGMGWLATVLALTGLIIAPQLVHYAAAVKPYGVDATVTVGLLIAAVHPVARGTGLWKLIAAGVVGLVVSTPAPFVLGGIGITGALASWRRRDGAEFAKWAAGGLLWLACFGALYLFVLREVTSSPFMSRFWDATFLDWADWRLLLRNWLFQGLGGRSDFPGWPGQGAVVVAAVACAIGASVRRRSWWVTGLLLGPIVVVAVASAAGKYPFADRLLLFTVPLVAVAAGSGFEVVGTSGVRGAPLVALLLVVGSFGRGWAVLIKAPSAIMWREDLGPLLADARFAAARSEPAYVFPGALPAWVVYSDPTRRQPERFRRFAALSDSLGPPGGNAPSRGRAVVDEGRDLQFVDQGRPLIVGVATGYEGVFRPTWNPRYQTDPGWGDNEAMRIGRATTGCVWTVFSHYKPFEMDSLHSALTRRGRSVETRLVAQGAEVRRYCPGAGRSG
ncbi:MAG: hypothetical protein JNJ80_18525 [Gemmatimonadetes bacterium]|nr:hypothetical protein [Gemmatimonadota bacterium]